MKYLSKQRIIGHVLMWLLIAAGVCLAFIFLPADNLYQTSEGLIIIFSAPFVIFGTYHLLSGLYFRLKMSDSVTLRYLIRRKCYGKCVHPTCSTLAILVWVIFFFFPDLRFLVSISWMTTVILFWIKLEESTITEKHVNHTRDDMNVA